MTISSGCCAESFIRSNLRHGETACPGRELLITCQVVQAGDIYWHSTYYIQSDYEAIVFDSDDFVGATKRSPVYNTTVAKLTNVFREEGTRILVYKSELRVIPRPNVDVTVQCYSTTWFMDSVTFKVAPSTGTIVIR